MLTTVPPDFQGVKEVVLVDFARLVGVPDEDEVDPVVAPAEKEVQQREEALRQVLLALAHRGGDVHQAEHHRPCIGLRLRLEVGVPDIERV